MSDSRLHLVRRSYDAFLRGDADALVQVYEADCEWDMGPTATVSPESAWRGHEGLRDFVRIVHTDFDSIEGGIVEARDDGERILIRGCFEYGMRSLGAPLPLPFGQVIEFGDGLIRRIVQTDDPPPGWDEATPLEL